MKTIIAGSRMITDYRLVTLAVEQSQFEITEVVSGGARGVDTLGERWADENRIPIKPFKPNWCPGGVYDNSAGFKRNVLMAGYADALVAVTTGSRGTRHMIETMRQRVKKVFVFDLSIGRFYF